MRKDTTFKSPSGALKKARRKAPGDISKDPAMIRLKELMREMTPEERTRTLDHLKPSG